MMEARVLLLSAALLAGITLPSSAQLTYDEILELSTEDPASQSRLETRIWEEGIDFPVDAATVLSLVEHVSQDVLKALAQVGDPPEMVVDRPSDRDRLRRSVRVVHEIGRALEYSIVEEASWLEPGAITNPRELLASESIAVAGVPVKDLEPLREHLVPRHLRDLPQKDGWGHPLEVRIGSAEWKEDGETVSLLRCIVRSPGRDGKWDGDTYERGAFPADELDRDVVWLDEEMLRWPEGLDEQEERRLRASGAVRFP